METTIGAGAPTLLRHPDFARFCTARFLSGLAMQMQTVAVGWLIYDLTHSALALGFAGLAAFLPAISLALVTGHVADRFDRRLILAGTFAVNALAAVGLLVCATTLFGAPTPLWLLYGLIALAGTARAFGNPASQALLPNLIPRALFSRGVALASSVWQTSTILGPALGGFLYALGPGAVFGTAAGLFAVASACAATIRHRPERGERKAVSWTSLVAGLVFIRSNPVILGATTLDLFAVLLGGATALLPIYAQTILNVGPWGLGLLRSMPGLGAVVMAAFLAIRPLTHKAGPRMFLAVGVFGLATVAFGLSSNLPVSMACLFVLGAADTISVVVRQTLVQAETPDAMRGRVAAVNAVFIGASNELGEFESGLMAAWLGAAPAVVLGGVGTILIAMAWSRLFPALRRRDRLVE
jgi:MFS family permease